MTLRPEIAGWLMRAAALSLKPRSASPSQEEDPIGFVWRTGELFMRREIYKDEQRHPEHIDLGGEGGEG